MRISVCAVAVIRTGAAMQGDLASQSCAGDLLPCGADLSPAVITPEIDSRSPESPDVEPRVGCIHNNTDRCLSKQERTEIYGVREAGPGSLTWTSCELCLALLKQRVCLWRQDARPGVQLGC